MDAETVRHIVEAMGYTAGTLTTLSFVPQVRKSLRSGSTGDLSGTMLVVFTLGVLFWLVYGVALGSMPIILTNSVTLALNLVLLGLKFRSGPASPGQKQHSRL